MRGEKVVVSMDNLVVFGLFIVWKNRVVRRLLVFAGFIPLWRHEVVAAVVCFVGSQAADGSLFQADHIIAAL